MWLSDRFHSAHRRIEELPHYRSLALAGLERGGGADITAAGVTVVRFGAVLIRMPQQLQSEEVSLPCRF
jgi:hypothetical protein